MKYIFDKVKLYLVSSAKLGLILLLHVYPVISFEVVDDLLDDVEPVENAKNSNFYFTGFLKENLHYTKPFLIAEGAKINLLTSLSQVRLQLSHKKKHTEFELSLNSKAYISNFTDFQEFQYRWQQHSRNRFMPLEYTLKENSYYFIEEVHRFTFSLFSDKFLFKVGRQAISWGQSRFINPIDLITPSGPFLFDIEDIEASDSLNLQYFINSLDFIQLVIIPYRENNIKDYSNLKFKNSNLLMRYKRTIDNVDLTLFSGYQFRSFVWGNDLSITKWGASFRTAYLGRLENATYYQWYNSQLLMTMEATMPQEVTSQFTLGVSYAFWSKLRSNIEFLYNSNYSNNNQGLENLIEVENNVKAGFIDPLVNDVSFFKTAGRVITKNPYFLQFSLDYDINTLLTTGVVMIVDITKQGYFFALSINYNLSDESIWVFSYRNSLDLDGKGESDFSGFKPEVYSFIRWHF